MDISRTEALQHAEDRTTPASWTKPELIQICSETVDGKTLFAEGEPSMYFAPS